jgi:ferric iron reductase protein FhuF
MIRLCTICAASNLTPGDFVTTFFEALRIQRFDDHRYYHHRRINQTLHLISAISFVIAYAFLLIDPVISALIAWLISMTTRQSGHFFFEPLGYDEVNQASHEYKEEIKVIHYKQTLRKKK